MIANRGGRRFGLATNVRPADAAHPQRRKVGDINERRELLTIQGLRIQLPDATKLVHLQFRRFTGCAGCNLHLRPFAKRHSELVAAGIVEIAVFYSSAASMLKRQGYLPFAVISDPKRELYDEFGVEKSLRSVLSPRSWAAWAAGAVVLDIFPSPPREGESKIGLPADFLIAADGRVRALKYGTDAYDQWSFDEVLERVAAVSNG